MTDHLETIPDIGPMRTVKDYIMIFWAVLDNFGIIFGTFMTILSSFRLSDHLIPLKNQLRPIRDHLGLVWGQFRPIHIILELV
jgi:hypothetical protein